MSDSSEDHYGHENDDDDHQHTDDEEWSDVEEEDSDDESDDHGSQDDSLHEQQGATTGVLKLCPNHNRGEMTKTCQSCSAAFALIKDKKIIAELSGNSDSSHLLSRYSGKCDAIETTLFLASDTVKLSIRIHRDS